MNTVQTKAEDWLRIVRSEFQEMPGLHLTKRQVQRFWGVDPTTCDALLAELVSLHFLKQTHTGAYARVDAGH